jgi:hypothetical protein
MRKIQAICTLGDATKFIPPGDTTDVSDIEAAVLVQRGFARYVEDAEHDLQSTDVRNQIDLLDEVFDAQDSNSKIVEEAVEVIEQGVDTVDEVVEEIIEEAVEEIKPPKGKKAKSK